MTASKRYVPVSLVCLLIASASAAMAGPSSMLDPYGQIQAPTAKEVEAKNNKARAKKGLPPIHASQANSSTKVEDASASVTTYVTAPGGGNGKVVKHTEVAEAKGDSAGHGSGKIFGIGIPKVSLPKVSIPGFGGKKSDKTGEPEVKIAKAPKVKVHKHKEPKAAKEAPQQEIAQKSPAAKEIAPKEIASKETPVGETPVGEAAADTIKTAKSDNDKKASGGAGYMVSKTLKSATSGMVNGSKKVGSSIAGGAKASGDFIAKGVSKVGHSLKGGSKEKEKDSGEGLNTKLVHMPSMFKKGHNKVAGLPSAFPKQNQDINKTAANKLAAAKPDHAQAKAAKNKEIAAAKPVNLTQPSELVSEKNTGTTAISNAPLGPNDELVSDSQRMKKSKSGRSAFSLLNPFSKKVAGKKQKQTL